MPETLRSLLDLEFLLMPKSGGGQLLVAWRQFASWRSHIQVSQEQTLLQSPLLQLRDYYLLILSVAIKAQRGTQS